MISANERAVIRDLAKKLAEVCVIYAKGKEALAAEKG